MDVVKFVVKIVLTALLIHAWIIHAKVILDILVSQSTVEDATENGSVHLVREQSVKLK